MRKRKSFGLIQRDFKMTELNPNKFISEKEAKAFNEYEKRIVQRCKELKEGMKNGI